MDLFGLTQRMMNKSMIYDAEKGKTVVKGDDGKLYFVSDVTDISGEDKLDNEGVIKNAEKIIALANVYSDIDFVFVQAPFKYDERFINLPNGIVPFRNEPIDYFIERLSQEERIDIIDLRKKIEEQNKDYSTFFFKTDHHWTIGTAFWAYQMVAEDMKEKFGYDIDDDYYDSSNWETVTYRSCFLGSQGTRTGALYAGKDDIDIIYPKYDTSFIKTYSTKNLGEKITRQGAFEESVLENYNPEKTFYKPTYNTYLYSDCDEIVVENKLSATDKKILVVKDSFGIPVSAFLTTLFEETRIVDLRYLETGLDEYIGEYSPDAVIFIYNPGAVTSAAFFDFEGQK